MIQEVKVKVRGLQAQGDESDEPIEIISLGQMFERDGFTCIRYEEVVSEEENGVVQVSKNLLKIREDQVEVLRKGPMASDLVFVPDQTTYTYYSTPMGEIELSIHTTSIERVQKENGFILDMRYELEMNQTFISSCFINVEIEY